MWFASASESIVRTSQQRLPFANSRIERAIECRRCLIGFDHDKVIVLRPDAEKFAGAQQPPVDLVAREVQRCSGLVIVIPHRG